MGILCPTSTAAALPMEDDDLLSEILLRLPPQPSSLPRASAVCKHWRRIASDPGFSRRFRRHHRCNPPPLIGIFCKGAGNIAFQSTMEPPNCIPPGRFSMLSDDRFYFLGCRHGLLLIFQKKLRQVLVWDPVAGDQHSFPEPPRFDTSNTPAGTVLCAAGDAHHFRVVLASLDNHQHYTRASAFVYSSETAVWSDRISKLLPLDDYMYFVNTATVLAGDSLYLTLSGNSSVLLDFHMDMQSLAVIHLPVDKFGFCQPWEITVMRAEGGGLGLLFISGLTPHLWKRNIDCDGVTSWVLGRPIELDKLLSLNSKKEKLFLMITGFAESNNVVFLQVVTGLFMVQLDSLQFMKISEHRMGYWYHPFESIYAAGIKSCILVAEMQEWACSLKALLCGYLTWTIYIGCTDTKKKKVALINWEVNL